MVAIVIFELLLLFVEIFALLRNYACDSLGELYYQLICAEERQELVSGSDNEDIKKITNDEVICLQQKIKTFSEKWRFFLRGKKQVSCFDWLIMKKKLELQEQKKG